MESQASWPNVEWSEPEPNAAQRSESGNRKPAKFATTETEKEPFFTFK